MTGTTRARLLAAMLLAASPGFAQDRTAPLPPAPAWNGASERLIAGSADPWITPAERSGFVDTPDYAATRAWLDRLDAASPLIRIESFGRTPQGRDLYAVHASKGHVDKGQAARERAKPVLLVQAGIHSGEIDGKDAGLMLLRDVALRGKHGLLDKADLVFVPIFNADGHERSSAFNRPNQRGPRLQGWRTTAQNLNLNRDYLKADAPEMRAMIGLINRVDPSLYLDLHVTDGTDHRYDVMYDFNGYRGHYAASPAIGRWLEARLRPRIDAALKRNGHMPGLYVDAKDNRDPDAGITHTADAPRYSTGYGDARHVPTVLVETHSLKGYRQRVLGTYVLVEAALRLLGDEAASVHAAIVADSAARPGTMVARWKPLAKPLYEMDFAGITHDDYASPASGRREIRWLGTPRHQRMKVYGQVPDLRVTFPTAYWVPATKPDVIERLRVHGIAFETLSAPRTVDVEMVRLVSPKLNATSEGRVPLSAERFEPIRRADTFPAGSVRVPTDQPLRLLAAALLEPEHPDSLLAWGFFPEILQRAEYIEDYAMAPLADRMLGSDARLRAEFEAKIAAEPAFAASPDRRLAWFYERTFYYDDRYLLYPVGREVMGSGVETAEQRRHDPVVSRCVSRRQKPASRRSKLDAAVGHDFCALASPAEQEQRRGPASRRF